MQVAPYRPAVSNWRADGSKVAPIIVSQPTAAWPMMTTVITDARNSAMRSDSRIPASALVKTSSTPMPLLRPPSPSSSSDRNAASVSSATCAMRRESAVRKPAMNSPNVAKVR